IDGSSDARCDGDRSAPGSRGVLCRSARPELRHRPGRRGRPHHRLRVPDALGQALCPGLPRWSAKMNFLGRIGRVFLGFCTGTGRLTLFTFAGVSHCFRPPIYFKLIGKQFLDIGYYSLPVVGLTAIFIGMVLALQLHTGFSRLTGGDSAIAQVVVLGMTRELGPVIAALMVAGRIGASI